MSGCAGLFELCDQYGWNVVVSLGRKRPELRPRDDGRGTIHDQVIEVRDDRGGLVITQPVDAQSTLDAGATELIGRLERGRERRSA